MTNNNSTTSSTNLDKFTKVLSRETSAIDPIMRATRPLDNVAFYDFAFYEYLLPTQTGYKSNKGITEEGLKFFNRLELDGWNTEQIEWMSGFLEWFEDAVSTALFHSEPWPIFEDFRWMYSNRNPIIMTIALRIRFYFEASGASRDSMWTIVYLFTRKWFNERPSSFSSDQFLNALEFHLAKTGAEYVRSHDINTSKLIEEKDYPFEIFPNYSVNVGLRIVYRQEWKPLGIQPGEIVRTIQLGPGQKERVTTKIVRRKKKTSTLETVTEKETTTETADTTKNSSEVVNEAVDSFNWKEDLDIGGKILGIGAESKTTLGENSEEKSKNTNSHLSESMKKAASKIRSQTKVVISTESEESFERENYSEISNQNNEMAVTYEYYKLQQQYEVYTYLTEVQSVIFVAERVPRPAEVNEDWVRKYDWIIAKVLKDESFRTILNELIQDMDEDEPTEGTDSFKAMFEKTQTAFATFGGQGQGLTIPDIYGEPQRIYQQHLKDKAARERANRIKKIKRKRLYQHIRDNILYYCRAIWAHEDQDQRILRYKKEGRRVPIEWLVPGGEFMNGIFTVNSSIVDTAPLVDIIDPTGPIGYSGNYCVFAVKPLINKESDVRNVKLNVLVTLNYILSEMRRPYLGDKDVFRGKYHGKLLDPALRSYWNEVAGNGASSGNFEISQTPHAIAALFARIPDEDTIRDMVSYLPRLEETLFETDAEGNIVFEKGRPKLLKDAHGRLKNPPSDEDYAEYLYRKNGTRRFLVDSNNLYLNIRASEGAALETFKRAHRYIDVLKANEELEAMRLKNQRRDNLNNQPGVYDPDIEKVIILGDGTGSLAANNAALHEAMVATPGRPGSPLPETTATTPSTPATSSSEGNTTSGDGRNSPS